MAKMRPRGFPVERGKIHEFANAILDEHPHYHDEEAARAAGLPTVVAPPTFPMAMALFEGADGGPPAEIAAIDMRYALHGAQELVFERPLVAGDVLTGEPGELKSYQKRGAGGHAMKFVEFETIYRDREGEVVARSRMTVVQTGGEEES
jgi:acyl dehydratase